MICLRNSKSLIERKYIKYIEILRKNEMPLYLLLLSADQGNVKKVLAKIVPNLRKMNVYIMKGSV